MNVFLICGYGIPKNIKEDRNYSTYLNCVFNAIFSKCRGMGCAIIPCGGPTSCSAPYVSTEAEVIAEHIQELKGRQEVREVTKDWRIFLEDTSLSTLENLVFSAQIIEKEKLEGVVTIFCEATRKERIKIVAPHIFSNADIQVIAIDFDVSANRYLDPAKIQEKEARELELMLKALESPENMAEHHRMFEEKFVFLREQDVAGVPHVEAVRRWYEEQGAAFGAQGAGNEKNVVES